MPDDFLKLARAARKEVLDTVAGSVPSAQTKQLSAAVLEKDVWVCWVLQQLFNISDDKALVFKGGTTLSKVFEVIGRFSEDIDVTIDYRSFKPPRNPLEESLSASRRKTIVEDLRTQANEYVRTELMPYLKRAVRRSVAKGEAVSVQPGKEEGTLEVLYPSALGTGDWEYLPERVLVEFGGRNTTEPKARYVIEPYLKSLTHDLTFPTAQVDVLSPKRTFWEKATLIHAELGRPVSERNLDRKARHWYDLALLGGSSIGEDALGDRGLLVDVVRHKKVFFKSAQADYDAALSGTLRLVPTGDRKKVLQDDYAAMIEAGMFFTEPPPFEEIVATLKKMEKRINSQI